MTSDGSFLHFELIALLRLGSSNPNKTWQDLIATSWSRPLADKAWQAVTLRNLFASAMVCSVASSLRKFSMVCCSAWTSPGSSKSVKLFRCSEEGSVVTELFLGPDVLHVEVISRHWEGSYDGKLVETVRGLALLWRVHLEMSLVESLRRTAWTYYDTHLHRECTNTNTFCQFCLQSYLGTLRHTNIP